MSKKSEFAVGVTLQQNHADYLPSTADAGAVTPKPALFPVAGIVCYVEGLPYTDAMLERKEVRLREFSAWREFREGQE